MKATNSIAVALLYALMSSIYGCGDYRMNLGGDYTLRLVGGYELDKTSKDEVVISRNDNLVIQGRIISYALKPPYITGLAKKFESRDSGSDGYFFINTETNTVSEGLTKEQWQQKLEILELGSLKLSEPF